METAITCGSASRSTAWPIGGLLLEALTRRDFDGIQRLCADDEFEILDASLGQVGTRGHARWRVRMSPVGHPADARIAEQQVYLSGTDRIETLDLLCSGFHRDLP